MPDHASTVTWASSPWDAVTFDAEIEVTTAAIMETSWLDSGRWGGGGNTTPQVLIMITMAVERSGTLMIATLE